MGFTNLTYVDGQKLTHTLMEQSDANFDAIAEGDPSGPRVPRPALWCQFCGKTDNEQGLYVGNGFSSMTRNAVGDYTLTFTNALSSTNVGIGISTDHAFPLSDGSVRNANGFSLTTSQMRIRYHASNETSQSAEDQIAVHVVVWTFGAGNY